MANEIPALEARESLRIAAAVAVGTGSMKPRASRGLAEEWRRAANAGVPRERMTGAQVAAAAAARGIPVVRVPAKRGP